MPDLQSASEVQAADGQAPPGNSPNGNGAGPLDFVRLEVEATDPGPLADTEEKRLLYRFLRARSRAAAELSRVKAATSAMIDQLEAKLAGLDEAYLGPIQELAAKMLEGQKVKSIKTPFGVVGFKRQPMLLQVEDKEAILAAVFEGKLPEELIVTVTETKVVKKALDEFFKIQGEIPPGCSVRPEQDAFYVREGGSES